MIVEISKGASAAIAGVWFNQHGSELRLDLDSLGRLSGAFRSNRGLAKPSEPCRVTGFAAGSLVVFAVDFGQFDSLTAWTGHHVVEAGDERIFACWHMAVGISGRHANLELWKGVWTGEDEFRRRPFGSAADRPRRLGPDPIPDWP
jgi:hypothetical protein